ncbi:MAG: hypothetical protein NC930_07740, partial [Candidatus Omnitrophica bacterium]|nr:hypothetical protein [Candidatus Omnitrophota bacterium]
MPLRDRLRERKPEPDSETRGPLLTIQDKRRDFLQDVKIKMHRCLIDRLNLEALMALDPTEARKQVKDLVRMLFNEEKVAVTGAEREDIIREVVDETFGLGPLEPLLADSTIDEIL